MRFIHSSILTFLGKTISVILIFTFQSILSHLIDVTEYGSFSKYLVTINYLFPIISLGLSVALVFFGKNQVIFINNYIFINLFVYVVFLLLGFILFHFSNTSNVTQLITYQIILMAIISSVLAYYQALEKFVNYNIIIIFNALLITTVLLPLSNGNKNNAFDVLKYYVIVHTIIVLIIIIYLQLKENILKNISSFYQSISFDYFSFGIKSVILIVVSQILYVIDIYLLDELSGKKAVAFYFVAVTISKISWYVTDSLAVVLFPRIIGQKLNSKIKNNELVLLSQIVLILNIILIVSFYFLGSQFLSIFYAKGYIRSFYSTIILLFASQGMVQYKLLSRKYAAENSWGYLYIGLGFAILINLFLNLALIPILNIEGAALASLVSYFLCSFYLIRKNNQTILSFFNLSVVFGYFSNKILKHGT